MVEPVSIASGAAAQVISDAVITGNTTDVGLKVTSRTLGKVARSIGCSVVGTDFEANL